MIKSFFRKINKSITDFNNQVTELNEKEKKEYAEKIETWCKNHPSNEIRELKEDLAIEAFIYHHNFTYNFVRSIKTKNQNLPESVINIIEIEATTDELKKAKANYEKINNIKI